MATMAITANVSPNFKRSCAMLTPNDGIGRARINVMAYFSGNKNAR